MASRLERLIEALHRFYGPLPPPPHDPFMLFVWEVLSVHSTPYRRDAALAALKRIPALTPDAMWRAPQKKLEESVTLAGPYTENRLTALRAGVEVFRRSPDLPAVIRGPLVAKPKPAWFFDNRQTHRLGERLVAFERAPSWLKIPGLAITALTG